MNITKNTILITGGTSGIGLQLAKELLKHNTVIVTGRDSNKSNELQNVLPGVHFYESDVADPFAIISLYKQVIRDFPDLNMLINNAGIMRSLNLNTERHDLLDIGREIEVDLLGEIRMVEQFLPHLKTRPHAAIVNISSGLAFVPYPISPVYSAAKAGVHAYTQALRIQLQNTQVKVFELAPPATSTPLMDKLASKSVNSTSSGLMNVAKLVTTTLKAIERDRYEIRPGASNILKLMSRVAPGFALSMMARSVAKDLAQMQA